MNALSGRLVVVPADTLGELLELATLAAERLPETDPLVGAISGASAQLRAELLFEP